MWGTNGGLLSFSTRLLYPHYAGRPERYGIDAVTDQRTGAAGVTDFAVVAEHDVDDLDPEAPDQIFFLETSATVPAGRREPEKLFGGMGLMLVFVLGQGMLLSKYVEEEK